MKNRKQALFHSAISLLLCLSMLVGSTFAWFTDAVVTGINTIAAGALDVQLYHSNAAVTDEPVNSATELFKDLNGAPMLWEPGAVSYENLRVANEGDLALAYQLLINTANENHVVEVSGAQYGLSQILKVGVVEGGITATDRAGVVASVQNANWTSLANFVRSGSLLPEGKGESEKTWGIVIYWEPGDFDNYWNLNNGKQLDQGEYLMIDLGVRLVATQEQYESDAFGKDYDATAKTDVFPVFVASGSVSTTVVPNDQNQVASDVVMVTGQVTASIPAGVQLATGATELTMTVAEMDESSANLTLGKNEAIRSLDVHIAGVDSSNTVPMVIDLGEVMPVGLNSTSIKLYHVENGVSNAMTPVNTVGEVDAHNEFYYDPVSGQVVVAMASFSEVACVINEVNPWTGNLDYSWYLDNSAPYTIANAEQLAGFGAIVGGMAKTVADKNGNTVADSHSFAGETVNLIADIHLGYGEVADYKIFYPIGYYNDEGTYEKSGIKVSSGFKPFEGTFNGQGHTIANFYQNTWEMKGDNEYYAATEQNYRDGMGLFGKVYGGTVKNLTVANFSSDGEYTTTGVIAAYADSSAEESAIFENIAIVGCNPRVYNIGNGGIVGCGGWYSKDITTEKPITFKNITVDKNTKISALWGSYDVACGGIMGQYYPNSSCGVTLQNCNVAAQIDVYNDVCGNYQYYAYRYAGMLIGSIRQNLPADENGHIYPNMDGITATGCTVHYDTWNDYFYCELVDNSKASYTHDHQMSRLTEVKAVNGTTITYLDGTTGTVPTSGWANYVVVSGEYATENATCYHFKDGKVHNHNDYDGDGNEDKETVNGKEEYVEDKRHIYLPFNQLFTGYGWGVTSKGLSSFSDTQVKDITEAETVFQTKFETKFTGNFLYRVGNLNEIKVSSIFNAIDEDKINDSGVYVRIDKLYEDADVSCTFTPSTTENWGDGTLKFEGTGVVDIVIQDYDYCTPTVLHLEVVDAMNVTTYSGLGAKPESLPEDMADNEYSYVLLDNITMSSGSAWALQGPAENRRALYGNGFTFDCRNARTASVGYLSGNCVIYLKNAILDNVNIVGAVYTEYGATKDSEFNHSLITSTGNDLIINSTLSNCAAPVRLMGGSLEIVNSTLKGGNFANLDIRSGNVVLEDVTTINQSLSNDKATDGATVVGLGIVIYYELVPDTTTIEIKGTLTQYNNISDNDTFSNTYAQKLVGEMLGSSYTDLQLEANGVTWANSGIVSMTQGLNVTSGNIIDSRTDKQGYQAKTVTFYGVDGCAYTVVPTADSIAAAAPGGQPSDQGAIAPNYSFNYTSKNYVPKTEGSNDYCYEENGVVKISMDDGETFDWDTSILTVTKNGQEFEYTVEMNGTDYTGKSIPFSEAGKYTVTYTYQDPYNYKADGVTTYTETYEKKVYIYVSVIKETTRHASFTLGSNQATEQITVNNSTYISAAGVTADGTNWGCMTVSGTKIYFPIVEAEIVQTKASSIISANAEVQAHFYVLDGVITITDYENAGTGNEVIYDSSTQVMPGGLTVVKGNSGKVADNTNWYNYNDSSLTVPTDGQTPLKVFCYAASSEGTQGTRNGKPCYSSPSSLSTKNRSEYYTLAQYSYTDFAGATYYYYVGYHMQDSKNVAPDYSSGSGGACIAAGTMITLADGSKKAVEELRKGDVVMAFDHATGEIVFEEVVIVGKTYADNYYKNTFVFDDGTELVAINEHGIYDLDLRMYVNIGDLNYEQYLGHRFASVDPNGKIGVKKLVAVETVRESGYKYDIVTNQTLNYIAEDTLSVSHEIVDIINSFTFGEDMVYDAEAMQKDIEKYGLYRYEDFAAYCERSVFEQYNMAMMKVGVGKGLYTYDHLVYLLTEIALNDDVQIID